MAAHQLYLLTLGELAYPNPAKGAPERVPITAYLIRTARGRTILVDSGAPAALTGAADSGNRIPGASVSIAPEDDIVARLGKLGLRPSDISLLVTSHFDWEHCGGHAVFAEAGTPALVQRAHYEHALAHPERYDPALFSFPGWEYQLIEGDTEIERGIALLETSGESIGHQSVYVNTANGAVLLPIDAIPWTSIAQTREFPEWTEDAVAANESVEKLMEFALDYRTYTIFGHDPEQWASLPASPRAFNR
ncbi:MAG: N-acyl homoserine lactonase family protein [Thermomicrobiales bacterium]|nr:N-acyl homoserine lactonase family protein [Thermomicrobiales bacterium]